MSSSLDQHALSRALEDLLVKEFRACQSLQAVTKEERTALIWSRVSALLDVVEQKEALLDELGRIEDERRMVVRELAVLVGMDSETPTALGLIPFLDDETGRRLERICEGTTVLLEGVRKLNFGNQALAASGLERADALQSFLLSLCRIPTGYQPPNALPAVEPASGWEVDHHA